MSKQIKYLNQQQKRRHRVRTKVKSLSQRPRLVVFRSNQHLYAQVVDHQTGQVLAACNDLMLRKSNKGQKVAGTKTELSQKIGQELVKKLKAQKVGELAFDRGHYKFHGRIKALAETIKKEGIKI